MGRSLPRLFAVLASIHLAPFRGRRPLACGKPSGRAVALFLLISVAARPVCAATFYVGFFAKSSPVDDADCGMGLGVHPAPHPCQTLAYWTANRRRILVPGDVVRLTGRFGPVASPFQCIVPSPGVTYEGRTKHNKESPDFEGAIVDASETLSSAPCHGGAINCRQDSECRSFSDFTLRGITLDGASGNGGEGNQLIPWTIPVHDVTLERVRISNASSYGLLVGSPEDNEDVECAGRRNLTNVWVRDSQFDHNAGSGLWVACVDGGAIERSSAFDNRNPVWSREFCTANPHALGCEGTNGFHFGGWINGVVRASKAHDNGYYNFNFSGNSNNAVCDSPTHDILVDGIASWDAAYAHFSFSHCNHDITVQNSFIWGHGLGFNQYACAHRLRVYNNTVWADKALQWFTNCRACDVRNNIFHCASQDHCIYVDQASRNPLSTWQSNVLVNEGGGPALAVYASNGTCIGTPGGSCDCPGAGNPPLVECPNSDPQSPGCPAPWKDDREPQYGNGDLSRFADDEVFGPGTGDGDRWGEVPSIVNPKRLDAHGLHLRSRDKVAKDAGMSLPPSILGPVDFDGGQRPKGPAWDVGADEQGSKTKAR